MAVLREAALGEWMGVEIVLAVRLPIVHIALRVVVPDLERVLVAQHLADHMVARVRQRADRLAHLAPAGGHALQPLPTQSREILHAASRCRPSDMGSGMRPGQPPPPRFSNQSPTTFRGDNSAKRLGRSGR